MNQAPRSLLESIEQDQQADGARPDGTAEQGAMTALVTTAVPANIRSELALAGVPRGDAAVFESKALALSTSKQFLELVSEQIGMPRPGETEDSFVQRAKDVIRTLLRKLLNG